MLHAVIMTYQVKYNAIMPRPFKGNQQFICLHLFALMPSTVNMVKVMAMEAISSSGEPIDVVVLNVHIVRLPSKYMFVSTDVCHSQHWSEKLLVPVVNSETQI